MVRDRVISIDLILKGLCMVTYWMTTYEYCTVCLYVYVLVHTYVPPTASVCCKTRNISNNLVWGGGGGRSGTAISAPLLERQQKANES